MNANVTGLTGEFVRSGLLVRRPPLTHSPCTAFPALGRTPSSLRAVVSLPRAFVAAICAEKSDCSCI